jgi:hypothetical protein
MPRDLTFDLAVARLMDKLDPAPTHINWGGARVRTRTERIMQMSDFELEMADFFDRAATDGREFEDDGYGDC